MKRSLPLLLALVCVLSLTACRGDIGQPAAKPVLYLYPEKETAVTVTLDYAGELTCTYPAYNNGWTITAQPDGTLTDSAGQTYNYLYWEGLDHTEYDFSQGFCLAGRDTAAFLENALSQLGLTRREANEFIVYWLPQMRRIPTTSLPSSRMPTLRQPGWPLIRPRIPCCGCLWPGNRWTQLWTSPPRPSPPRSGPASPLWNGAAAR